MSVKVMGSIWEHSPHKGSELLLLLAIADNADDLGLAWPSQETLAAKMRMSVRQVRRLSASLESDGAFTTERKRSGSKTHIVYTLVLPPGQDVLPQVEVEEDISAFQPDIAMSAEPSIEPPQEQDQELDLAATPQARTARDCLWDSLEAIFGKPGTRTARALRGRIVSSLIEAGATVEQVEAAPAAYHARMPAGTTLTETALEKHWPLLSVPLETVNGNGRPHTKYGERDVTGDEFRALAERLEAEELAVEQRSLASGVVA